MKFRTRLMSLIAVAVFVVMGMLGTVASTAAFAEEDYEVVAYGRAAQKSYLSSIKSDLYYAKIQPEEFVPDAIKIPVLNKSRELKKYFTLKKDEVLVIPAGKTLTITGGADINGTVYIEKGGRLNLQKYSVTLAGSIVCDGVIAVTGGTLWCADGSLLYIGRSGQFTARDRGGDEEELNGRIDSSPRANVVCVGATNIPDPTFDGTPAAAIYHRDEFGGSVRKTSVMTGDIESLLDVGYDTSDDYGDGDFADYYTILFSGGASVVFTAEGKLTSGWNRIGNVNVQLMSAALRKYRS